jgi:hypothetical protein
VKLFRVLALFLTSIFIPGSDSASSCEIAAGSILPQIESYRAPSFPRQGDRDRETYDYRIKVGTYVPPTLTDVFIADLWTIMTVKLNLKALSPRRVLADEVDQALKVYQENDWKNIPGLRPWTHWNFVRCLSIEQRASLAKEAAKYVADNGVKDVLDRR